MTTGTRSAIVAMILGAFATSSPGVAFAYNNSTHARIVSKAVDVMRLATTPSGVNQIKWPQGVPAQVPQFGAPGSCALAASDPANVCGRTVTTKEWSDYLDALKTARTGLGRLNPQLALLSDSDRAGLVPDLNGAGIFDGLATPKDTTGFTLGWQAQSRDDDADDLWVDVNLPIVSQLLGAASDAWEGVFGAILVPFVCFYDWLFGNSDCHKHAHRLADQTNPIDLIRGIIPGWKNEEASKERGVWHFINLEGRSNWYDDTQGMFYEESGPNPFGPSGVDQAVMVGSDILALTLDASHSAGTERYEITDEETSFPHPSEDRANWSWQSETIGHTQFSPLDNFALYGHNLFLQSLQFDFGARGLGWPLHAIGDATVPMHVVGTSGWGHRPYEDFVDHSFGELLYEICDPTLAAQDPMGCKAVGGTTALFSAQLLQAQRVLELGFKWYEFVKSHPDTRDLITQIATETLSPVVFHPPIGGIWCDPCSAGWQAARTKQSEVDSILKADVIEYYTKTWSREAFEQPEQYYRGRPELFSQARSYLELAAAASIGYLAEAGAAAAAVHSCFAPGEVCVIVGMHCCEGEDCRSFGGPPVCCISGGEECTNAADCCSRVCSNGVCGNATSDSCSVTSPCAEGTCEEGRCCQTGAVSCAHSEECCSAACVGGICLAAPGGSCTSNSQCAEGACSAGKCCNQASRFCGSNSECCSGVCTSGSCVGGIGACSQNSDCPSGSCVAGACRAACADEFHCASHVCQNGACNGFIGQGCDSAAQCDTAACELGVCCQPEGADGCAPGSCCGTLTCNTAKHHCEPRTCSQNSDCPLGECVSGTCQLSDVGSVCSKNSDCATGTFCVQQAGAAAATCCLAIGGSCESNSDCCGSLCLGNKCQDSVIP